MESGSEGTPRFESPHFDSPRFDFPLPTFGHEEFTFDPLSTPMVDNVELPPPKFDENGDPIPYAPHYVAIDCERRGSGFNHPVCAMGWRVGPVDLQTPLSTINLKERVAIRALPGQEDEQACMDEFWSHYPVQAKWIKENEKDAVIVMLKLRELFKKLSDCIGVGNITLLSDNHEMDLGRASHLGWTVGVWNLPIRFFDIGVYHSARDPRERFDMLTKKEKAYFKNKWLPLNAPGVQHTHFPDDDAEYVYYKMLYCDMKKRERQDEEDENQGFDGEDER